MARNDFLQIVFDRNQVPIQATEKEWVFLMRSNNVINQYDTLKGALCHKKINKPAGILKAQIMMRSYKIELTHRLISSGIANVMRRDVEISLRKYKYDIEKAFVHLLFDTYGPLKQLVDEMIILKVDIRRMKLEMKSITRNAHHKRTIKSKNDGGLLALAIQEKVERYHYLRERKVIIQG